VMNPPSDMTCQNCCNRSGRMKIEYSATDNTQSVRVAITARTQAFLIASTGIYAVSVTLGPTSFTPTKRPLPRLRSQQWY